MQFSDAAQDEKQPRALDLFKAMADESRLKIIGILAYQERSVDELAEMVGLRSPTISHHLAMLKAANLVNVRPDGTTRFYRLNAEGLQKLSWHILQQIKPQSNVDNVDAEDWERRVLHDFFEGSRLKEIPAVRKKRQVILRWLASQFERHRTYAESEINDVIKRHHADTATLRRELIASKLMRRERGSYWRVDAGSERATSPIVDHQA